MLATDIIQKAIVMSSEGNVLLLRRSKTDVRRPLQWDFPGGMLDEGEPLEQGVAREIREESGICVDSVRLFFSKTELGKWIDSQGEHKRNVVRQYFSAKTDSETVVLSDEHDDYCWVSLDKALELLEYDRHRQVISHIIDNQLEL